MKNLTNDQFDQVQNEVSGLDYYELKEKYQEIGKVGEEDYRTYFFKYNDEIIIEYHDRADTTVTTLSLDELIEYYNNN